MNYAWKKCKWIPWHDPVSYVENYIPLQASRGSLDVPHGILSFLQQATAYLRVSLRDIFEQ